jgi:hypothetical protein
VAPPELVNWEVVIGDDSPEPDGDGWVIVIGGEGWCDRDRGPDEGEE